MIELLNELNNKQKEAVVNTKGPCLVIAGAGSGKTKVLTQKIAYLIKENNISPWNILAITFTNKAANEMKNRIEKLIGNIAENMWIGTFHSICVKILRKYINTIGFDSSFIIFDSLDQKALIKDCMKQLNIDEKAVNPKLAATYISNAKNEMLSPEEYEQRYSQDYLKKTIAEIYKLYQIKLKQNNAIDFDDIINHTTKVLLENSEALEYYSNKFEYVLVDEYQDTNKSQFMLITLLAARNGNITVVGDNDQGIYSFRGADIKNILNFERDFPGTKIIKLEQNYRSTASILSVANEIIKNNEKKYDKNLWTENGIGQKPKIHMAANEYDEATYIVEEIRKLKREEYYKYNEFAVLYRTNAQSRSIEDILRREDIPYKIVGGVKFYERKEIKDIMAYLRLVSNSNDNLSLKRIINEPKRGIGKTSIDKIEQIAEQNNISMYEVVKNAKNYDLARVFLNSREFVDIIEDSKSESKSMSTSELTKKILKQSKYLKELEIEDTIEAQSRIENINEFLTVVIEFEDQFADNSLEDFLESITLTSDLDNLEETEDSITLMTLHNAKGLEFQVVFLTGLEEGLFPSYRSIGEQKEIEEERRLFYVGLTRARQYLYLTYSKQRTIFGSTTYNKPSRFINEIPQKLVEREVEITSESDIEWTYGKNKEVAFKENEKSTYSFKTPESFLGSLNKKQTEKIDLSKYKEKQRVLHKKFGEGIIKEVEIEGEDLKVTIEFIKSGTKRLMAKYAGLEIIE